MENAIEFRVLTKADCLEVFSKDPSEGGLSDPWSLMTRVGSYDEVGEAIAEELAYRDTFGNGR